jgi:glycosyltransferase involved in cell wall biosynthesis
MVKVADALFGAGYAVRVISASFSQWASELDAHLRCSRNWRWSRIDYERESAFTNYLLTGVRYRVCNLATRLAPAFCSPYLANCAYSRIHAELIRTILAEPADLIYAGTGTALGAAAEAAIHMNIPYALDLEDFHSAEEDGLPDANYRRELVEGIERKVLPNAVFVSAASDAIASAYAEKYGIKPMTVNNTFPLPTAPVDHDVRSDGDVLRLYWFSQTIGPGRGLEQVVEAIAIADVPAELHVRGNPLKGYIQSLMNLGSTRKADVRVIQHPVASPDLMTDLCSGYDVGLALEPGFSQNNMLALSNKALTYLVGGLAVALTDTPGQRALLQDLGEAAIVCAPGDANALATGLKFWSQNRNELSKAKLVSWQAASRRWHWEHPLEKGAVLDAVARALNWEYANRDHC